MIVIGIGQWTLFSIEMGDCQLGLCVINNYHALGSFDV